ncbi:MAG: response regulator transcription factor [bacterium]
MSGKIMIVEDEDKIARFLELELIHEGYDVEVFNNGQKVLENELASIDEDFDLILLDIMLPEISGMKVCARIREQSEIPIIMVTAKDSVSNKVEGLDYGADDYITKPFAIEELLARIRAQLRRQDNKGENILELADLKMDNDKHQVQRQGQEINLTKKEYDLLEYLLENKEIVVSREQLLRKVWGYDYTGETNIVDVYIRYLRSKIDEPFSQNLIQTVRGVGYVLREE